MPHTEATHNGLTMLSGSASADELAALVQAAPDALPPASEPPASVAAELPDPDDHLEIPGEADPPKDGFREWIDPETKKNLDLRRKGPRRIKQLWEQNQTLKQQLEDAKRSTPPVVAPVTAPPAAPPVAATPSTTDAPDPEPDPSNTTIYPDGQFDRKFLKDQARWEARQELQAQAAKTREAETSAQRRTDEQKLAAELQTGAQQYEAAKVAARAKYPDFDQVLGATTVGLSPVMNHAILTSPHSAEIAYHLATHPEDAQSILTETALISDPRQMPLVRRTLEALVSHASPAVTTPKPPPPAPPRSAAPPPAQPVGGGSHAGEISIESQSVSEIAAQLRREELASRRRGVALAS